MVRAKSPTKTTPQRRQDILEAALKSFSTKGFTDTTMEDIHHLSGASMGSIYHHFESKENLAVALYIEGLNNLHARLLEVIAMTDQPQKGVKALVQTYLFWFEQHRDWGHYLFFAMNTGYLATQVETIQYITEEFLGKIFEWLLPFVEEGKIMKVAQPLYVPLIIGPSRDFLRYWLVAEQKIEIRAVCDVFAGAAWKVLCPSKRTSGMEEGEV